MHGPLHICVRAALLMRFVAVLFCGGVCAALGAENSGSLRPNFLVIVSDDQRPDTIHALGNPVINTPNLDRLVRQGMTFTRAIAPDPLCVPSRAEIMTGCSGFVNGVRSLGGRMDSKLVLWGDAMRGGGYSSWYVGKWMNDGKPVTRGYDETLGLYASGGSRWPLSHVTDWHGAPVTGYCGWVFQQDDGTKLPEKGVGLVPDISREFADAAIEFINRGSDKPFFLHVNFTAPHDPLLMPPSYEEMYDPLEIPLPPNFLPQHPFDHGNLKGRDERLLPWPRTPAMVRADLAVYYSVISHMDEQIGRMLEALRNSGQAANTYVLFTSDHGLAVGSHGLRGKQNMYEHTVGVPLIIAGPQVPAGKRSAAQCYLRDMYPTVCELAGIEIPKTVQARSLVPVIRGRTDSIYPEVFGHFRDVQRMIRTSRWKLIWYPRIDKYQLFDLVNDRAEQQNLADQPAHAACCAQLRAKLAAWQQAVGDPLLNE